MTVHRLHTPLTASGLLMTLYLLLRPYGDAGGAQALEAAAAFADQRWVVSHLAGLLALCSVGVLMMRLARWSPSRLTRSGAALGAVGVMGTLPYYGAETFGLHVIGQQVLAGGDQSLLVLVDQIRSTPAALVLFGIGLLAFAAAGVLLAVAWQRRVSWAGWPLGLMIVLILPQFALPPEGRMAFGVLYLLASLVLVRSVQRAGAAGQPGAAAPGHGVQAPRRPTPVRPAA